MIQLGPRLGQNHILSVFILYVLRRDRLMGMTVNTRVNSRGIGNHTGGGPFLGNAVFPEVSRQNHIISSRCPGCIHAGLHLIVQLLAALVLTEGINIIALAVLEICRCGFCKALRRGNAYKSHLSSPICKHLIRRKNRRACGTVYKIAGIIPTN